MIIGLMLATKLEKFSIRTGLFPLTIDIRKYKEISENRKVC